MHEKVNYHNILTAVVIAQFMYFLLTSFPNNVTSNHRQVGGTNKKFSARSARSVVLYPILKMVAQLTQNIRGTFNFALQNIFSYRTLYECFLNVVNVPGKHK